MSYMWKPHKRFGKNCRLGLSRTNLLSPGSDKASEMILNIFGGEYYSKVIEMRLVKKSSR